MEPVKGIYSDDDKIGQKIWNSEYFGHNGAIALAREKYERSITKSHQERILATFEYACALYSAIGNCFAQLKKFRLQYFFIGVYCLFELDAIIFEIVDEKMHQSLDTSRKESLMAYLLICRIFSPFSGYRKMAIELGKENHSNYSQCTRETLLLTFARMSRFLFYPDAKLYRKIIYKNIHNEIQQKNLGWKTVYRLAKMIDDKEMVLKAALLSDSRDVRIKAGIE